MAKGGLHEELVRKKQANLMTAKLTWLVKLQMITSNLEIVACANI